MPRRDKIKPWCCDPCTNKPGAGAPGNDVVGPSIVDFHAPLSNGFNMPIPGVIPGFDRFFTRGVYLSDFAFVDPQVLLFDRRGESKTILIISSTPWRFAGELPDWVTISPFEGRVGETEVTITAKNNPAFASERSFALYIEDETTGEQLTLLIIRQEEGFAIFVEPKNLYFGWDDTIAQTLQVTANDDWKITDLPCKAKTDITSGASGETTVLVSLIEGNTGIDHTGTITFECGDAKATVAVEHEGMRETFEDSNGDIFWTVRDGQEAIDPCDQDTMDENYEQFWVIKQQYDGI